MQKRIKSTTFYCFSPPVMLATFIIEFSLAIYAVYRYHLNEVGKLIVAALISLGIFQIAEYFVCGGYGLSGNTWSRIGYVAITALPPLGLHMMLAINKSTSNRVLMLAYGSMAAFMAYFLLSATAFTGYQCTGNYVIFQIGKIPAIMYGLYYYGWLLAALVLGVKYLTSKVKKSQDTRNMTKALMIGTVYFWFQLHLPIQLTQLHVRAYLLLCVGLRYFLHLFCLYIFCRSQERKNELLNIQQNTQIIDILVKYWYKYSLSTHDLLGGDT